MSRLHLLILWILAIGAGTLFLKSKSDPDASASKTKLETGSPVFAANTVDSIDEFKIEKGEDSVTLKKIDDNWVVAEQDNFPANLNTVTRTLDALRDTKVAQGVAASDEYYNRFNLDPTVEEVDERPDTITLMSEGQEGDQLYLGKSRQATGGAGKTAGRFIRLSNDDSGVYIVQQTFASINADPENWIDKVLTPLEEGTIKFEVSAPQDETFKPWTISRKTVVDDFLVEGLNDKEETKTNETGTLKNTFARANFIELLSEEDVKKRSDKKGTREVKATDSAGSTFLLTIIPEKKEEEKKDEKDPEKPAPPMPSINFILTVQVLNGPTKPETPAADASTQEKAVFEQRVANLADLSSSVNRMRERLEGRYFLINTAAVGSLLKSRGEFIQPKKVVKPKTTVTTKPLQTPSPGSTSKAKPLPGQAPPPLLTRPKTNSTKKPKIEAVTPPIEIPNTQEKSPKKGKNKNKGKGKGKKKITSPPLPGSKPE